MSETLLPTLDEEWRKPVTNVSGTPLVTSLGLVEGEVLLYLEEHGPTSLQELIRELEWSARLVVMGVGALIRQGLIRGIQKDVTVVVSLEPVPA